jgi:hypothetical protein
MEQRLVEDAALAFPEEEIDWAVQVIKHRVHLKLAITFLKGPIHS